MTSVDPRRTQPFCTPRCYRECRCSRWPGYKDRFGQSVAGGYGAKVLSYSPIAYWPLSETNATTAYCLVNPAQNGTYNSPVQGWPPGIGIGDGNTAPYFDGTNDFVDVGTAAFKAALDVSEGTTAIWAKVGAAADWTDGTNNYTIHWFTNGNNAIRMLKSNANNTLRWIYAANAAVELHDQAGQTTTDWFHMAITWSVAADRVWYYLNGVPLSFDNTLGVWAGAINLCLIGTYDDVPLTNPWHGWLAHCVVFDRPLTPAEILALATV